MGGNENLQQQEQKDNRTIRGSLLRMKDSDPNHCVRIPARCDSKSTLENVYISLPLYEGSYITFAVLYQQLHSRGVQLASQPDNRTTRMSLLKIKL